VSNKDPEDNQAAEKPDAQAPLPGSMQEREDRTDETPVGDVPGADEYEILPNSDPYKELEDLAKQLDRSHSFYAPDHPLGYSQQEKESDSLDETPLPPVDTSDDQRLLPLVSAMNKMPAVAAHVGLTDQDEQMPEEAFGFVVRFVLDQNQNGWRSLEAITMAASRAQTKARTKDAQAKITVMSRAGDTLETMMFCLEGVGGANPNDLVEELHDWETEFPVAMSESDHLRCLADVVLRCSLNSDLLPFHIESLHADPGYAAPTVIENVVEEIRKRGQTLEPDEVADYLREQADLLEHRGSGLLDLAQTPDSSW